MSNELLHKLLKLAEELKDVRIKKIVTEILSRPTLSFSQAKPLITIAESPAAPRKHHMFSGGLLIHTYSVVKIALALCNIFEEIYGININRDLVIASAILHDIYKYYQYTRDEKEGGYRARDDWYLSHDYAIVAEIASRGGSDELIRVISEVHGVAPIKTYEGLIVHLADSIDAKFGEYLQNTLLLLLRYFEDKDCKPYIVLDEIVKRFGIAAVLKMHRDTLLEAVADVCKAMGPMKSVNEELRP